MKETIVFLALSRACADDHIFRIIESVDMINSFPQLLSYVTVAAAHFERSNVCRQLRQYEFKLKTPLDRITNIDLSVISFC